MANHNFLYTLHQNRMHQYFNWLFLILVVVVACTTPQHTIPILTGTIPIHAPSTASAGSDIEISIGPVDVANGTPIGLVMVGVRGPKVYNTVFINGQAFFKIPAIDTLQTGYVALIVASENARGEASIIMFASKKSRVQAGIAVAMATIDTN